MARSYTAGEGGRGFASSHQYTKSYLDTTLKAVKALDRNEDARDAISNILESINEYQRTVPQDFNYSKPDESEKAYNRERKLGVADLVKTLPPNIRAAIEVPRSTINKLFRGVKERNVKESGNWVNGKFVYGFSKDKEVAEVFAGKKDGKMVSLITAKDIKSFGGIISTKRLYTLVEAFNRMLWRDDKTFDRQYASPLEDSWRNSSQKKQTEYAIKSFPELEDKWGSEEEHLVYDLEYKDGLVTS